MASIIAPACAVAQPEHFQQYLLPRERRREAATIYKLNSSISTLDRAGHWFLNSGIQEASGGVARYRHAENATNLPISNEITGYTASALAFLFERTEHSAYRDAGQHAANFLIESAWDAGCSTYPFEPGSNLAYYFDLGIIARGLMASARVTTEAKYRQRAEEAALSLAFDFLGDNEFIPVITLPEKQPLPYEARWSRQPGCFLLKASLIWRELDAVKSFDMALAMALASHDSFLNPRAQSEPDRVGQMDRLHAYCYFLEALLSAAEHPEVREALGIGIERVSAMLRDISPLFERSDVCGQLLRVRLIAHHLDLIPLDVEAATEEAKRALTFERPDGGFWFGRKHGEFLPFVNPVSTAFCLQALALWEDHRADRWNFTLSQLI